MAGGSLPGSLLSLASLLAVASPIAALAGLDARQSSIEVYQYDDNDFEGYINIRDTATRRLPFQTEFAQRFVLPAEGAVRYVEICVRKPQVATGPSADVLMFIQEFWSDTGNVPGVAFYGFVGFMTGVPPGYRTCKRWNYPAEVTLDAGPVWVSVRWGNDPEDPNSLQDLAVDEDSSSGRRAFRVIHEDGEAGKPGRKIRIRVSTPFAWRSSTPGRIPSPSQTPNPNPNPIPSQTPIRFPVPCLIPLRVPATPTASPRRRRLSSMVATTFACATRRRAAKSARPRRASGPPANRACSGSSAVTTRKC